MLQSTNSMKEKQELIRYESQAGNTELFEGFKWGFGGFTKFGVKEIPEAVEHPTTDGLPWVEFEKLLVKLSTRGLTGNAAKDAIQAAMESSLVDQWNLWYRLILKKEFRSGFTGLTVNESIVNPEHRIPVFTCMLAHDGVKHQAKMKGKKIIDVKIDGIRMLSEVHPNGTVQLYSREGKDLNSFVNVVEAWKAFSPALSEPMVFDSEIVSKSFKETMRSLNSKFFKSDDASLYIFDMLPLADFKRGRCDYPQLKRRQYLDAIMSKVDSSVLYTLPHELVDLDSDEGYQRYLEINRDALKNKFEGLMAKEPEAPYVCSRSFDWLKDKPFIEITMLVEGLYEGLNKNQGSLGGLACSCEYEGHTIRTNVGGGFSDDLRRRIWDLGDLVLGLYIEVRADGLTRDKFGNVSLRFGRFKTFRGTVPGELL